MKVTVTWDEEQTTQMFHIRHDSISSSTVMFFFFLLIFIFYFFSTNIY